MTYTSLFRVTVAHSYYSSGYCECLQYKPSLNTQTLMNTYGLILKSNTTGLEVFATTNQPMESYLNYIKRVSETTGLTFMGIATDPNFYNFTELPINQLGVLSFASNRTHNDAESENIQLVETFDTTSNSQNAVSITIQFDDLLKLYTIQNPLQFSILLNARKTQWNYYIINNSNQEFKQLEIQSDPEIQFSNSTTVTLQNGQNALVFSSQNTKIPLKNSVQYHFNLINTKTTLSGERTEIIINGLPIPNPQNLQVNNDLTIASLIYVYI